MSKISAYSALTAVQHDDLLPIVDIHDTSMASSGTTKNITVGALGGSANGLASLDGNALVPMDQMPLLRDVYLRSSAIIGESVPRSSMLNSAVTIVSGTLYLQAVALPANQAVGHLDFASAAAATSPTHWWMGLFDNNRNLLALTADQTTTAISGSTYWNLAIASVASGAASSFTTTYTGLYYVGLMVAATTPNTVQGAGHASAAVTGQTPVLYGATSTTGQTTPPAFPFTAGAITPAAGLIYTAVTT